MAAAGLTPTIDLNGVYGDELHVRLREASDAGPVALDAMTGAMCVFRHHDVEQLAHEPRLAGVGLALFDALGVPDGLLRRWYGGLMFTNEGDPHHRLRTLVSRAFTPKAVNRLRTDAAELAAAALAPFRADGGGDLVDAFGLLPMHVMCRLLGVPRDDVAVFGGWADDLSPVFGYMTPEQIDAAEVAIADLLGYVENLVARRRRDPGDDLITALLAAEVDGGRLTHDEVLAMVANLLVGGHDTTASQLACTALTLLRYPEETGRLRAGRELVGAAVAESLRYEPSLPTVPRTVAEPTTVVDRDLPVGSMVFLMTGAANRESTVWADPDRFDVGRFAEPGAPRLLTFGAGPHYCLGAALARLTVEEGVRALLDLGRVTPAGDPFAIPWRVVLGRAPATVPIALA